MVNETNTANNDRSQDVSSKIQLIVDSVKNKKTLGQQVLDKFESGEYEQKQCARETTNEMGKSWNKELEDCITKHAWVREPYYIQVILKHEPLYPNAVKAVFFVRKSRPLPEWNTTLYKMDNKLGMLTLEWTLPDELNSIQIVSRPDLFSEDFVRWCQEMAKGTLV